MAVNKLEKYPEIKITLSIPWGEDRDQIRPNLIDRRLGNDIDKGQIRQAYAPLRFRIGAQNHFYVLNADDRVFSSDIDFYIYHFDSSGDLITKTPLPPLYPDCRSRRIIDFTNDSLGSFYILEEISLSTSRNRLNRLFKIDQNGSIDWETNGPISDKISIGQFEGRYKKILMGPDSLLYLVPELAFNAVGKINPYDGKIIRILNSSMDSNTGFLNDKGSLLRTVYFNDQNLRGISSLNIFTQEETLYRLSPEFITSLLFPIGIDDHNHLYTYKPPSAFENPIIEKISLMGDKAHQIRLKDMVVSPDNTIFLTNPGNNKIMISEFCQGEFKHEYKIPLPDTTLSIKDYWLINVDENYQFHFLVEAQPGKDSIIFTLNKNGKLLNRIISPVDLLKIESGLTSYQYWQVSKRGDLYISLTGPDGFKIVSLNWDN